MSMYTQDMDGGLQKHHGLGWGQQGTNQGFRTGDDKDGIHMSDRSMGAGKRRKVSSSVLTGGPCTQT